MRSALVLAAFGLLLGCMEELPAGRLPPAPCPERMAHLPDLGSCIDRYEAALEGPGLPSRAIPAQGIEPARRLSWPEASSACRRAGFRLCSAEEWVRACTGRRLGEPGGRTYPYGDEFEADRCNTTPNGEAATDRGPVPGGSRPGCVTPEGVFDLSGNVDEWVSTRESDLPETRGGNFSSYEAYARCEVQPNPIHHPENFRNEVLGFRCCADAAGGTAERTASGEDADEEHDEAFPYAG